MFVLVDLVVLVELIVILKSNVVLAAVKIDFNLSLTNPPQGAFTVASPSAL